MAKMARLSKYFDKGFDVVLPGLDVEAVPQAYLALGLRDAVVTPSLRFSYSKITGNQIMLDKFILTDAEDETVLDKFILTDAEDETDGAGDSSSETDLQSIIYNSNLALLAGYAKHLSTAFADARDPPCVPEFSIFAEANCVGDVLKPWPDLTLRQVENSYATDIFASIWNGKRLAYAPLVRFVTTVVPHAVLADVAARVASSGSSLETETCSVIYAAISAQKAASSAVLLVLKTFFAGKGVTVLSPTDTFLRDLVKDPAVFYGAYYASSRTKK